MELFFPKILWFIMSSWPSFLGLSATKFKFWRCFVWLFCKLLRFCLVNEKPLFTQKKKIKPFDPTNNNQCTNYESFKKINIIQDFFSPTKLNLLSQLTSHTTSYQKKKSHTTFPLKKRKKKKKTSHTTLHLWKINILFWILKNNFLKPNIINIIV